MIEIDHIWIQTFFLFENERERWIERKRETEEIFIEI
jgi:hypothetical protein